jgi:cytochrome c-type biogenesis protein CcmH/NrfG
MSDVQRLDDELALRTASLEDARREFESGELTEEQFNAIQIRESTAIERVRRDLAALSDAAPPEAPRRARVRRARWLVLALACFAVVLGAVLYSSLAPRQAGTSETGSLSLGRSQQIQQLLDEGEADIANGNVVAALSAYEQVLTLSAKNVTALTQSGWLDFSAGSADHKASVVTLGVRRLEEAVTVAPDNAAPRLYLAIVAASIPGNRTVAVKEFHVFLRLKPSAAQLAVARPFLRSLGISTS